MASPPEPNVVWRSGAPAAPEVVEMLAQRYPGLPAEYLAFLRAEDGSEGDLGVEPGWVQLWPAADVPVRNEVYEVAEWLPGFLGFGSNGGGELLAFDTRTEPWRICMVPFIPMEEAEAIEIAPDFAALARLFGMSPPAG